MKNSTRGASYSCLSCKQEPFMNSYKRHITTCKLEKTRSKNKNFVVSNNGVSCHFCLKHFKNRSGVATHQWLCDKNPN